MRVGGGRWRARWRLAWIATTFPITDPAPIRKILTHLGEPLEPSPLVPARGPPTGWAELVQAHDDRDAIQASPHDLPVIDIRGP